MKFVDYVTVTVRSGSGGPGLVSFQRDKISKNGGPNGGDGGHGGSVKMVAKRNLYTLLDLRYNRHHFAQNGAKGGPSNKTGKSSDDVILYVPLGTMAKDYETKKLVGEVLNHDDEFVLAKGGMGGKGNAFFKSATNQAPQNAQPGVAGEEFELILELKLLADVGLVGLPNAGKSTLISVVSEAKPKIADYPFTTLAPQLGIVKCDDYRSFSIADIPGIIEGASEGKGLGFRFLKHIERNAVLLFVLPISDEDPLETYRILLGELETFNPELLDKPRCLVISKMDLASEEDKTVKLPMLVESLSSEGPVLPISSIAHMGLDELKRKLLSMVDENQLA